MIPPHPKQAKLEAIEAAASPGGNYRIYVFSVAKALNFKH